MIEYFGHFRNKCSVLHESKSNTRQRKPKYHPVTHDRQQRRRTLQTARNLGTGRVALQDPSAAFSTASKKYADFVRTLHFVGMLDAGWIYEW